MRIFCKATSALILLLYGLLLTGCPAPVPEGVPWREESLAALQAESQLQGNPLLVLICPGDSAGELFSSCAPLLQEAATTEMQERAAGVLPLLLVASDGDAKRLIRQHDVQQLPSFLMFSADGILLVRRDGADSFSVLQPFPEKPATLAEVAAYRLDQFHQHQDAQKRAGIQATTPEEVLATVRKAIAANNLRDAGDLISRLDIGELELRDLVDGGDLAEQAGRPDLAVEFWQQMLNKYPDIGARSQALDRFARTLVQSGQAPRLEQYVFAAGNLRSQWEYLTVATAVAGAGETALAKKLALHGMGRFPTGPHTEALRFYTEDS